MKKYSNLIKQIAAKYELTEFETRSILNMAIADAYGGINEAVVWDDQSVTVAFLNGDKIELKDYRISSDNYEKILSVFKQLLESHIAEVDGRRFFDRVKIFEVVVKKETGDSFVVNLEGVAPYIKGFYQFIIQKRKQAHKNIKVGDKIAVSIRKIEKKSKPGKKKKVYVERYCKEVAEYMLLQIVKKINKKFDKNYEIDKVNKVTFSRKNAYAEIYYEVKFASKPSSFFMSQLNKILNKAYGLSRIVQVE